MDLAFATVNIEDSRHIQKLTEATVRNLASMKQVCLFVIIVFVVVTKFDYYTDFVPYDGVPSCFLHCSMS